MTIFGAIIMLLGVASFGGMSVKIKNGDERRSALLILAAQATPIAILILGFMLITKGAQ